MAELQEAEIRARIKRARKEAGLAQPAMAELLGVIPRTVQNYENDHVPWGRIRDIAEITGRSTRWLLHGDETQEEGGALLAALTEIEDQVRLLRTETAARDAEVLKRLDEGLPPTRQSRKPPQP
jgi:transcriptional regulator with XRE-family HTH domain